MKVVRNIVAVLAAISLVVSFVGAGFLVCTLPAVTHVLANAFSDDVTSPFSRSQLVQVADVTRDYAFGVHDKTALYHTIYEVDSQYRQALEAGGGMVPADFPRLDVVSDTSDPVQFMAAFATSSEMYCYSADTISHLDDCHQLASAAYPLLAVAAALAVAGLLLTGMLGGKRRIGLVLTASGVVVLVVFVGLGAWAFMDFTGFFAMFHQLFFSQGNWVFPYDSLLICALPTAFWIGMGTVWLATTVFASILCIVVGRKLGK